jgi:isopentenyldiphosphate isomerase
LEFFETFDEDMQCTGRAARDVVHREGLWHRSSQVFVFDQTGALLVQRRAVDKDLYASLWDYSVGEHLQPGESFVSGAHRGLAEELAIVGAELIAVGPVRQVEQIGDGFVDREIQQAFACRYGGDVVADPVEVAAVEWVARAPLLVRLRDEPDEFTPWFKTDIEELGFAEHWDAMLAEET